MGAAGAAAGGGVMAQAARHYKLAVAVCCSGEAVHWHIADGLHPPVSGQGTRHTRYPVTVSATSTSQSENNFSASDLSLQPEGPSSQY